MPPTTLRDRYPLSPRKFWKKILGQLVPLGIFAVFFAFIASIFSAVVTTSDPIYFLTFIYGVIGFVIFFGVSMLLYAWYVKTYIRRYYYDATDSYITIKKGVFAPAEIHVQYSKIQDVYVDQDIVDRIMGLYDVHLSSATVTSGIEAHIDGVEQAAADGLKNFLLQRIQTGGPGTPSSQSFVSRAPLGAPSEPVTFKSEVSSRSYPIVGMWFVQQAISGFLRSFFFVCFLILIFFIPGRDGAGSLADMFSIGSGVLWTAFPVLFVVVYASNLIYTVLWSSNYSFNFLPDYIVMKQGIIAKSEKHLPYRSVQDVLVSQGIIERMFGLATVRIENAAQMAGKSAVSGAVVIIGQPFMRANEISDAVKHVALAKNSSQTGL